MATIRALIVGVSDYSAMRQNNLPFCNNDIYAIATAFVRGLKVDTAHIITCGISGTVLGSETIHALQQLSVVAEMDDTLLVYFSGHGGTLTDGHNLLLSDMPLKTQNLITYLEAISAKNKILFLDCCMSGDFSIGNTATFNINETADEFAGKGYAVLASSNATQYSYGHPDRPISLFTSFLCEALTNTSLIREGKKSLYDISKLLSLFLEIWNKNNPTKNQSPIYRANIGGTIFFEVQDYQPYIVGSFFEETEQYIIYAVEPTHSSIAKRYSAKIILKKPLSFLEISQLNHEIVEKVKVQDIYQNEKQSQRWRGQAANLVFCYFGLDETDIINTNYLCHTTWADDTQDKKWWYRAGENCEVINNIHFNVHSYYQSLKVFTEEHTGSREKLIADTRAILSRMITLAEQVIALYNEFLNGTKSEDEFADDMKGVVPEIDKLYFAEGNLDIPPDDLKDWCQHYTGIAATIHDFTLFYNSQCFAKRTPENRKACMDLSIKQYYKELEKLKSIDSNI
jgi:hypothetical protein